MKSRKLFSRQKAKNGEGRQVVIKHLLLPEDVLNELRLYKEAYSLCLSKKKDESGNPVPIQVTWEQMLRRWMSNVSRFDKDVKDYVENKKTCVISNPSALTFTEKQSTEEIANQHYYFKKDDLKIEAIPGDLAPFYAKVNEKSVGMRQLNSEGWILINESGIEIDYNTAKEIRKKQKAQ